MRRRAGRANIGRCQCFEMRCILRQHHDPGADLDAAEQVGDVFIGQADAAAGDKFADRRGIVGAMNAIFAGAEIHRAGAERIAGAARHKARQIRLARDHLRRRMPIRPFRLAGDGLRAGPGEALAADADAVANGAVLAEHVIERGVAGIDDHGAWRFAGIQGNDGSPQPLGQRAGTPVALIGQRALGGRDRHTVGRKRTLLRRRVAENLRACRAGEQGGRQQQGSCQHQRAGRAQGLPAIGCGFLCHGLPPFGDAHRSDALHNKRGCGPAVPLDSSTERCCQALHPSRSCDGTFSCIAGLVIESGSRRALGIKATFIVARRESWLRVFPNERALPGASVGTPLPDSKNDLPPVIRRAEMVAFVLVALLVICLVAVLYVAKAFFLPVVTAFVVGTMLSPAAGFLERHRIPRAVSAVLIVAAAGAAAAFIVGLISSPLMEWSTRLPELGSLLRDKLHIFDRSLALWQQLQSMLGGSDALAALQMPKFEWVQPAVAFLSPTFTEFLLFFATLILFIASWKDLRRALIMTFADHASRLRTLRILNEIEEHLGGYLLTVTMINLGVGAATGIILSLTGMPNPAGLGALAATLNFLPIIGPVAMFAILTVVGVIAFPTLSGGLIAPAAFIGVTFLEGHFVTPTIIGRRLELN